MKLSVSLSDDDVRLLDQLAAERGTSRSSVLQQAVSLLRDQHLAQDYADAWAEWDDSDSPLWDSTSDDGLTGT
jgi:predicted transcriptional regulator